MNRQEKRRYSKKLKLSDKELNNLSEHFRKENEANNRVLVSQFLALTVEALRLEVGFGQGRIDRYGARVNSLLDSINLDFVTFDDLLEEINIAPQKLVRLTGYQRDEIKKKTEELRKMRLA
jgi:hypothetical protein|nr:MAG TPA: hypothetical protein [Caudoviricetes sp.]